MTVAEKNRIHDAFARAKREGRAAFVAYLPAGYPDHAGFLREAATLLEHADLLEIGLPYSDPLGDGPTIQKASEQALRGGATIRSTFESARALRERTEKPLVIMTYYNPILAWGEERFVRDALAAGVDGLILPDLPPDEAGSLRELAARHGLRLTFLIAPTSTPERIRIVAEATTGFLYAVSVTGVTGARAGDALHEVPAMLELARRHTDLPIAVGFGVAGRESAHAVALVADG
ncbi:tryptophan synthase subunit alpha, partial [Deinococcus pimensis]|uniref:tryptophan synthase subunit alpha n=1 Tax=Deinococcus pimensis TaxID=309888 RepID=UPI000487FD56